ncbi:hypothetical protein M2232_004775 [Bradyrhizobium japonicum]|nr:hypothetical protein [Bradyrhizobium japonicum]MCW2345855.1 hypothetical protein [Bradyrhizobium japonicum]
MRVEGVAKIRRTDGRIADLAEVRATMSRARREAGPAIMPAAMRVSEAMTAKMAASMMTATMMTAAVMTAAVMATAVMATAMSASVPTTMAATVPALAQSRARQHAGKRHHGNSNDRSQHRILPQSRAIEAAEIDGNWNRPDCRKFRDRDAAGRALKRDEIGMNHHRALGYCLSMIFSENRGTLFRIMLYASGTILPGLKIFSGSSAFFSARIASSASGPSSALRYFCLP